MYSVTEQLLAHYDVAGPRYTSYPTADRFVEQFDLDQYTNALSLRREGFGAHALPLSLYIHVPFCESICYYCACNKIITKKYEKAIDYLDLLHKEIEFQTNYLGPKQSVSQLHLGGGSPTYLNDDDLHQLMITLRSKFNFLPKAELSIEIDPRTVNRVRLQRLRSLGFNRISFGVQDFEPAVQAAVHRIQPLSEVKSLMQASRELEFDSINMDLIYGLPKQTSTTFNRTLDQVIELSPDRLAIYAYAHLPDRFKPQRRIVANDLPVASEKLVMLSNALNRLQKEGYVYIGMDHFAKTDDGLSKAKNEGRLHRNFQGYSIEPEGDLLAFGVSAIGKVGSTYSQNAKTLEQYANMIDAGLIPIVKGLRLTRDDELRREVIMSIMCQGELDYSQVEKKYGIVVEDFFATEVVKLKKLERQELIVMNEVGFTLTPLGWYFVRAVAMVFDEYLNAEQDQKKFSKII